jgi:hypothetical protein
VAPRATPPRLYAAIAAFLRPGLVEVVCLRAAIERAGRLQELAAVAIASAASGSAITGLGRSGIGQKDEGGHKEDGGGAAGKLHASSPCAKTRIDAGDVAAGMFIGAQSGPRYAAEHMAKVGGPTAEASRRLRRQSWSERPAPRQQRAIEADRFNRPDAPGKPISRHYARLRPSTASSTTTALGSGT